MKIKKFNESTSNNIDSARYWWYKINDLIYPLKEIYGYTYGINYATINDNNTKVFTKDELTITHDVDTKDNICFYVAISLMNVDKPVSIDISSNSNEKYKFYKDDLDKFCKMSEHIKKVISYLEKNDFDVFVSFDKTFNCKLVAHRYGLIKDDFDLEYKKSNPE